VDPTARRDITGAGQQRLARYEHRRDEYIRQLAHLAPRLPEEQKARLAVLLAPAIRQVFGGDRHAYWSPGADVMQKDAGGGFSVTVDLDAGRAYRFRYLLDDQRWDNDWAADAYVANDFGGEDSGVDLTALAEAVPPAAGKTPAKKEAVRRRESAPS